MHVIMNNVPCLLRAYRRKAGLSQQELGALIPGTGHHRVSDIEQSKCLPNAREIVAYQVLFGVLPRRLFSSVVGEVVEDVAGAAYRALEDLRKDRSPEAYRKRAFLEAVLKRATKWTRHRGR